MCYLLFSMYGACWRPWLSAVLGEAEFGGGGWCGRKRRLCLLALLIFLHLLSWVGGGSDSPSNQVGTGTGTGTDGWSLQRATQERHQVKELAPQSPTLGVSQTAVARGPGVTVTISLS